MDRIDNLQVCDPGARGGRWRRFATVGAIVALALSAAAVIPGEPASAVSPVTTGVLTTGAFHTCALTATGGADCWGRNNFGQAADQAGPYTQLAAGAYHTCGLTATGAADCWGSDDYGQAVDQAGPYTQLAAGTFHTCGLTATGAADCWGHNGYGQAVDQTGPYTQLAAGDTHTCGLTAARAADCWGGNYFGQTVDQPGPYGVSTDSTPPTIGYTVDGVFPAAPDGDNGWYVGDVVLDWTVVEGESPASLLLNGCVDTTVTSDQPATDATCAATSDGGNAEPVVVRIARDATPPGTVWAGGPADGATPQFGSVPPAPTCSAVDGLSGGDGCTVTGYSMSVGPHTLTATGRDRAGNVTVAQRAYTVLPYTLAGFRQPVDMGSVLNTVKGGSTVPFKFEVFSGSTELTDTAVVRSFTWANIACTAVGAEDAIEQVTSGSTVLRYDTTAGQFVQNWQTPKNRAGACFGVTMTTVDGSSLVAYFLLR